MNQALAEDKSGFKEYLQKKADAAFQNSTQNQDPVQRGKFTSEMVAAFWFMDHYPVKKAQLTVKTRQLGRGAVTATVNAVEVIEHEINVLEELYITQEDYRKAGSNGAAIGT